MECTQRLECTQDLYETRTERVCPEQIGFLGICGVKHPVKKGPNKIGRDPQTCNIVLNLNSISRQHAVINILNKRDFMLMDLDSANKTKLMDKILLPYIPHQLKNGDMVQFGDIFGVFRLLDEDDDLPMTQAIDIPDTPISTRHVSKLNKIPNTTVPESPDVSDRDDSFIAPSQPKAEKCFRNSNSHYVKPSSNTIAIKPMGSNKIDNIYWSSSKRSVSLNSELNESCDDSNKSDKSNISIHEMETQNLKFSNINAVGEDHDNIHKSKTIHEMETQNPFLNMNPVGENPDNIHELETQAQFPDEKLEKKDNLTSIHEMETQVPYFIDKKNVNNIHELETQAVFSNQANDSVDSIYTAETQIPYSPSIHSLATQLPEVCKINNQQEMQINLFAASKELDEDIFSAVTQPFVEQRENVEQQPDTLSSVVNDPKCLGSDKIKLNMSDDEILLEEVDTDNVEDDLNSQPIIPLDLLQENDESDKDKPVCKNTISDDKNCTEGIINTEKKTLDNHSDSSTDCEDVILPGLKNKDQEDDDLTDCEDSILEEPLKNVTALKCEITTVPNVDFEDMLTQRIDANIEDLPTQVITLDDEGDSDKKDVCFEDLPTQVIHEESVIKSVNVSSNMKPSDVESPFKIPFISPIKLKRKDMKINMAGEKLSSGKVAPVTAPSNDVDNENYYEATQDILEDLSSQQDIPPKGSKNSKESDIESVPCSVEDYKTGDRFPHLENNMSPTKTVKSSDSTDDEDKVTNFVSNLTRQQIRDVVGVEPQVDKLKKEPSYPSDVEVTPKKVKPISFMDIDFPNSQEIKTVVSQHSKIPVTESSSESETEIDSQEQCTPILFKKKKKPKKDAKIDLTKKFDVEALPTRVMTRVRKPTSKLQNDFVEVKKITNSIIKPKFMTEQEEEIDKDIISENISRLKSKSEKSKLKDKKPNTLKDAKSGEKENKKQSDKVINIKDEPKIDLLKSSIKDSTPNVKVEKVVSKTSHSKISPIETKNTNTRKKRSKRKSDDDNVSITKTRLSDKDIEDNSSKDTSLDTNASTNSTRSTRGRRMVEAVKTDSQVEEENSQKTRRERSARQKQQTKKPIEIDLTEEATEVVRRSKRQRSSKEKKEEEVAKIKSILRKDKPVNLEQSTVYSLSSESDSPVNLKRPASSELRPPSPKRTRSNMANVVTHNNTSLRSTPARMNRTQHVLFTAFPSDEVRAKLEKLGAVIVSDVTACTMVLTLQIKRTFKLLCAVGLGKPIVGPGWVQACADSNMIVDPWLYVLKDETAEKRFHFNLERILQSKRNFLKGYNVSSTPNALPNATEMKLIVECSGGVWKEGGPQWVCVSCAADKALWPLLKNRGAIVVSTEFILGGVLRQRVDIAANKL